MDERMDERLHKRLHLVQALLFGLPGVLLGGTVALVGVYSGLTQETRLPSRLLLVCWGTAGALGIVAWLYIGAGFLLQGRSGLQAVGRVWWALLALGALAAVPAVVLGLVGRPDRTHGGLQPVAVRPAAVAARGASGLAALAACSPSGRLTFQASRMVV